MWAKLDSFERYKVTGRATRNKEAHASSTWTAMGCGWQLQCPSGWCMLTLAYGLPSAQAFELYMGEAIACAARDLHLNYGNSKLLWLLIYSFVYLISRIRRQLYWLMLIQLLLFLLHTSQLLITIGFYLITTAVLAHMHECYFFLALMSL